MLYKFKSAVAADVIMLEPTGRWVLAAMGKDAAQKGILLPEQMPQALADLEAAAAADDTERAAQAAKAKSEGQPSAPEGISLRVRAVPLVAMIKRSAAADKPITWGV